MTQHDPTQRSYLLSLLFVVTIAVGSGLYIFRCGTNPPGFFVDESSIAYNALTISQTGRDEFGNSWPIFFKAFGDYKNPVHVYLLALLFKISGPGILSARLLSAIAGAVAAALLGLLATWLARSELKPTQASIVGILVMTTAFMTPWLFEISRVVLEVSLYPLVLVLFLFCVRHSSLKSRWGWIETLCLSVTLALLTYTYSIGRLLAPLLAFGLLLLATRERWPGLIRTWAIYLLTLIPLLSYQRRHAGALTDRFYLISNLKPGNSPWQNIWEFSKHYLGNIDPRRLFLNGDPNIYQVAHLYGKPLLLITTLFLLVIGIWRVLLKYRHDSWWRFVVYAAAVSIVPASLTVDYLHMLRLAALPVFLLVLTVPALIWLVARKQLLSNVALGAFLILTLVQGFAFQISYHRSASSSWRRRLFDAAEPEKIFNEISQRGFKPIYVIDPANTPYIQIYWYGALHHFAQTDFVRLKDDETPPPGAFVISVNEGCVQKKPIAIVGAYTLYLAEKSRALSPLPSNAYRARLSVLEAPATAHAGERIKIRVLVQNESKVVWPGCQNGPKIFQIYLGSHWLDPTEQHWDKEEGRSPLSGDLSPGQATTLDFSVTAPSRPGEYVVELDLLQEGVSWFGPRGSTPVRLKIKIE